MLYYVNPRLKRMKQLESAVMPCFHASFVSDTLFKDPLSKSFVSSFSTDLIEKQKLKYTFLFNESVLKKYLLFQSNRIQRHFLETINLRLDSILVKLGYFTTIKQARQFIVHGQILVNFTVVGKPSLIIKKGDIIGFFPLGKGTCHSLKKLFFNWSTYDKDVNPLIFSKKCLFFIVLNVSDFFYNFIDFSVPSICKYYFF